MSGIPKCLTPECECRLLKTRGLCRACYNRLLYLVQKGSTSWEELENQNKCAKVVGNKDWRRYKNPFVK